ncbi:sulfatase-like hydrolase/transferase [Streptosporangium canum]|uniref:sulfatase-like hydrolase/transferase n=1 Tax=Streptosporangium canum TaxID=324952 RepID=UPI0036749B80
MADRPNILWFVSEDCAPHGKALGDGLAHTPTIDRLATEGVVYDNAFSTYPVCAPSRFSIISGVHAQSCGPAHHMRSAPPFPPGLTTYPQVLRAAGYHCTNNAKTDYNCDLDPAVVWDESSERAHWSQAPQGKPFLAVFNCNRTHESALFREDIGPVSPAEVRVPAYLPDTDEIRADFARYYTAVEAMDREFAVRLRELEDAGVLDDTVVLYSSDHSGVAPWTKRFCHDQGLRVPLVIWAPPRWQHLLPSAPGTRITAPVTHIDIAPTLIALGGAEVPVSMQGTSLLAGSMRRYAFGARDRMDERYDMVRTVRGERYRYIRNYAPHRPTGQHLAYAWQAAGYRSWEEAHRAGTLPPVQRRFFEPKSAEELYDTMADPDHLVNLIDEPAAAERVAAMRIALDEFILRTGDMGFIPDGLSVEDYPLPEVMVLAELAITRSPANRTAFAAALGNTNAVVRYWGAQGMLMLGPEASAADLVPVLDDPCAQVRIATAEALIHVGLAALGVARLVGELAGPPRVRLQAVNALTYAGAAAAEALPHLEPLTEDDDTYVRSAARYLVWSLRGEYMPSSPVFTRKGTA